MKDMVIGFETIALFILLVAIRLNPDDLKTAY